MQVTSYELRVTSYELRVTSYELRVTSYELRVTSYEFAIHSLQFTVLGSHHNLLLTLYERITYHSSLVTNYCRLINFKNSS
ncbi:MAG: hypothetical protein WCY30_05890, partial [Candidatus Neomarinimicrobiota bacterium]